MPQPTASSAMTALPIKFLKISTEATSKSYGVTEDLKDLETLFLVLLLFLNFLGNANVIIVGLKDRDLRCTPRNITLASLAFSDLLMVLIISFRISTLFHIISGLACHTMAVLFGILIAISILHLFVLSIDSYVAVFYPLSYPRIITLKRLAIMLGAVWCIPVVAMILMPLFIEGKHELQLHSPFYGCVDFMSFKTNQKYKTLTYVNATLLSVTPLICMIVVYLRIAKVSWYQSNRVGGLESGHSRVERTRAREMKWAKTIGIVIGALTVFYLPIIILHLYQASYGLLPHLSQAIQFLAFIHTAVNPIVYSLRSREFRKALLKICRRNNAVGHRSILRCASSQTAFGVSFGHSSTSSSHVTGRRHKSWIENEMSTTSSSFTIFSPMHNTRENITNELIESNYNQAFDDPCSYQSREHTDNGTVPDLLSSLAQQI